MPMSSLYYYTMIMKCISLVSLSVSPESEKIQLVNKAPPLHNLKDLHVRDHLRDPF